MRQGLIGSRTPACCRVDCFYQISQVRTTGGRRIRSANPVDKTLIPRKFFTATLTPEKALRVSAPPVPTGPGPGSNSGLPKPARRALVGRP